MYVQNMEAFHRESGGASLLVLAVLGCKLACVVTGVLTAPVSVPVRDQSGGTPLHVAARAGNAGSLRLLLALGADPNARDSVRGCSFPADALRELPTLCSFCAAQLYATIVNETCEDSAANHVRCPSAPSASSLSLSLLFFCSSVGRPSIWPRRKRPTASSASLPLAAMLARGT